MLKWLMMMNADNCLSYVVTSIVLLEGILEKSVRKDVWRPTSQALIYVNVSLDIDIWIEGLFCFVLSKFRMTAEYFVYTTTLLNVSLYYRRKKEAYNKRRISLKLSKIWKIIMNWKMGLCIMFCLITANFATPIKREE